MKRREKKQDSVIWEGVRVFTGYTLNEVKRKPKELVVTHGFVAEVTKEYVYVRHQPSRGVGDWTIIPAPLVKKIVRKHPKAKDTRSW